MISGEKGGVFRDTSRHNSLIQKCLWVGYRMCFGHFCTTFRSH